MLNKKLYVIILAILLAIIFAYSITPYFYYRLNTDFKRTKFIVKALNSEESPMTLLFGNSILMSGINAKILSNNSSENLIYNLATSGQSLKESFLFYTKVPSSVKAVYQFVMVGQLEHSIAPLSENIIRNLIMSDYHFDSKKDTLLPADETTYFLKNNILINYQARTVFLNSYNHMFRKLMRKDLLIDSNTENLFYPFLYTQKLDEKTYHKVIEKYNPRSPQISFHPDSNTIKYLIKANTYFQKRGITYYVVLYPLNPDLSNITLNYKTDAMQKLSAVQQVHFINCMDILGNESFVDQFHMNNEGAIKFSNYLKTYIQ